MSRLRSNIWVSAYLRRCSVEGAHAVLGRRGADEAGVIFVRIDHLDGRVALYGPAPQSLIGERREERLFVELVPPEDGSALESEERLRKEIAFDPDLWIVEVEDRAGRHFLDLA